MFGQKKKGQRKERCQKRKRESQEWYRIQKQNEDHNNRLLMQTIPKRPKKTIPTDDRIYAIDSRFRAHSPVYD